MPTKTLPAGSLVLDAASFVSLQAVRNAVAHPNCDALELYNGGRYGCTIEHVKIVVDSGKCMGPNWERRANEAMFGSGAWAVDSARAGVEKWGIDPSSVPTILSGVDFSTTTADWPQCDFWFETACDRADETDTWIGYYGETKYGNHLIQQPFWTRAQRQRPTWTWGGSGMINGTNMKQHVGFPSGVDWSSVLVTVDESRVETGLAMVAAEGDPQEDNMTPDESAKLIADVAEIKATVDRLASLAVPATNPDGSPVWKDPYGNPMAMSWQQGWPWELIQQIRRGDGGSGGGLTEDDVRAIINATHLKTG
jgi:hypothetical protein